MQKAVKRFDLEGSSTEIGLAEDAINRCTYDFGLLRGRVSVTFMSPSEIERVPRTNDPALAFCRPGRRELHIRSGLRPRTTRSVVLHEIGHMVDADRLRRPQRQQLMALMKPAGGAWGGGDEAYRARPCECFAETFVSAFSDVPSWLSGYYQRKLNKLAALRSIVLSSGGGEEEDDEPPNLEPEDDPPVVAQDDEPEGRLPVNVVADEIGTIATGTPFFHPYTGVRVTSARPGGDFELVGETEDGRFRFAVVETGHLLADQTVRALFLVEAQAVHDIRSKPGAMAAGLAGKLDLARRKAREIVEL